MNNNQHCNNNTNYVNLFFSNRNNRAVPIILTSSVATTRLNPTKKTMTTTATATAGRPVIITATVTEDKTDISSVTVTYRITSDADIKAVTKSMVQDGTVKSK